MKNTGGAAFPLPNGTATVAGTEGMTLRDYFAAAALQGICAKDPVWTKSKIAQEAYDLADAMLTAREEA